MLPCCEVLPSYGFGTKLWTLKRVDAVIARLHGVRFGQTQVWHILGAMGFSPQKPDKLAMERNEDAVRSWKHSPWPALKKSPSSSQPQKKPAGRPAASCCIERVCPNDELQEEALLGARA
ncbi:winged helix-turn-helix domain-containing protein [Verminephrobacter eiseniae]|nr:winged helix-turn-helix domain-containing protein [Verminephrobacter eiseniae]